MAGLGSGKTLLVATVERWQNVLAGAADSLASKTTKSESVLGAWIKDGAKTDIPWLTGKCEKANKHELGEGALKRVIKNNDYVTIATIVKKTAGKMADLLYYWGENENKLNTAVDALKNYAENSLSDCYEKTVQKLKASK